MTAQVIPFQPREGQRYERKPGERADLHRKLDVILDSGIDAFIKNAAGIIRRNAAASRRVSAIYGKAKIRD